VVELVFGSWLLNGEIPRAGSHGGLNAPEIHLENLSLNQEMKAPDSPALVSIFLTPFVE
jgi:hypothetical protein